MAAKTIPANFAERIRRLRGRLGMTQIRFAERMGVSFATVNRWENGQSKPSALAWNSILRVEAEGTVVYDSSAPPLPSVAEGTTAYPGPPRLDFSSSASAS